MTETGEGTTDASKGAAERGKLLARAGIVGLGTLVSRVFGLARDVVLAKEFDHRFTDAFFVAFTIPNALRQLLGEGAVSSAVVPVLSAKLSQEGEAAAQAFFARIRGLSLLALVAVTVLGVLGAEPLARLFAGGYESDPVQFARVVNETRLVFPYILFMGTAALGMAALHTHRRFTVASFAPTLLNVALVVAALTLPDTFEAHGIDRGQALVVGALVGGVLQVMAQWPSLRAIGYGSWPRLSFRDEAVREVLRRMAPMTFGIGVYYIDLVLSRRFLSELGSGAQSYFTWASRICDFPQGIFVLALSTAALPALSTLAAEGQRDELLRTYAHGLKLALFVALPCSVALLVLAEPLVVLFFQRGAFTAEDAGQTARALAYQGSAIWTVAVVRQVVPVFHALGDTRSPVIVSALDLVAFVIIALFARGTMGHAGVSLAIAGSSFVQMALLLGGLRRHLGTTGLGLVVPSAAKTLAASGFAAALGWSLARVAVVSDSSSGWQRALPGLAGSAVFAVVFVVAAWALRSEELGLLQNAVKRRLGRGKVAGGA